MAFNSERQIQKWDKMCLSKSAFRNEAKALRSANRAVDRGVKLYTYCCPYCQHWHLTRKAPHER